LKYAVQAAAKCRLMEKHLKRGLIMLQHAAT